MLLHLAEGVLEVVADLPLNFDAMPLVDGHKRKEKRHLFNADFGGWRNWSYRMSKMDPGTQKGFPHHGSAETKQYKRPST